VNRAETDRLTSIARKTAWLRWSDYEKMAAHGAADFAPDPRREL